MNELFRRRRLPHWDVPGATYFVTTCLEGSIPARGQVEIERYRRSLDRQARPPDKSRDDWAVHQWKLLFVQFEHWLDQEPAVRHLADPSLASIIEDGFLHFAGERYELWSYVVMPSHIHWVFRPFSDWEERIIAEGKYRSGREAILKSVNGYTARECNKLLGREGAFWQKESYDHWIRDEDELERIMHYVEGNPVKAGLIAKPEDWEHSSASFRIRCHIPFGQPLVRIEGAES